MATKLYSLPELAIDINQKRLTEAFELEEQSLKDAAAKFGDQPSPIELLNKNERIKLLLFNTIMGIVMTGQTKRELESLIAAAFLVGRFYTVIELNERATVPIVVFTAKTNENL